MTAVCMYFQVHQPYRLRPDFDFFCIGSEEGYEDVKTNRDVMQRVATKCYLPTNKVLLDLAQRHQGKFRFAFSISGTALEQMEAYAPEALASFQALAATGCAEFIAETYYHSLALLFSEAEFRQQVKLHQKKIYDLFGQKPTTFRNTELIYDDHLGQLAESMGFRTVLAEGADRILGWRSPNYVYRPVGTHNIALLLKNYQLSDDVAFRFSSREWSEWPLTADKYAHWLHHHATTGDVINLFMDYETFGEHQWESTGIFEFLRHLPEFVLRHPDFTFKTPNEVSGAYQPVAELSMPFPVSWADTERDTSAWLGNPMQNSAAHAVFKLEKAVLGTQDKALAHAWRKLQTSDHFYYMCTKWFQDGDVHKYFNPYQSPYDAFVHYTNALNQLHWLLDKVNQEQKAKKAERRQGKEPKESMSSTHELPQPLLPAVAQNNAS